MTASTLLSALHRIFVWGTGTSRLPSGGWPVWQATDLTLQLLHMYGYTIDDAGAVVPYYPSLPRKEKDRVSRWLRSNFFLRPGA